MNRNHLERRVDEALDGDINAHLRAEELAEEREAWIENRAAELRDAYGPFGTSEMGEAMESIYAREAAELFNKPLNTPLELMDFALATIKAVEEYWTQYFKNQAIKEYYSECRF